MNSLLRAFPAVLLLLLLVSVALVLIWKPAATPETLWNAVAWVQPILLFAVGIGWITMAGIELVKPQLRGRYHRNLLRKLGWREDTVGRYVLELPIERLTAQLQASGEFALRNPDSKLVPWIDRVLHYEGLDTPQAKSQMLQRRLDHLQLRAESEWRSWLRLAAIGLSSVLSFGGVLILGDLSGGPLAVGALVVAAGIIGGHFASVARDLVALVERNRR